ncbi:38957_t:CDS:1, partial [Gigaspora margarita]
KDTNKTKAQLTSSVTSSNLSNQRANASFTWFFIQVDETNSVITYCKIRTWELEELIKIEEQPTAYVRSGN